MNWYLTDSSSQNKGDIEDYVAILINFYSVFKAYLMS